MLFRTLTSSRARSKPASWRGAARLGLLLVPALGLGAIALWTLHHPSPRVRAPVPITRNSLLPHRYAGPCINCHVVLNVGPVAIDASTMDRYALTPTERQLILAGQRVEVPALSRRVSIPAITRTDGLPHSYVGVCSNCHVELDVHPSPEFMQRAMLRASQPLIGLSPSETARGGALPDDDRSRQRRLWGYAALPLALMSIGFIGGHVRARRKPGGASSPTGWLMLHEVSAATFCVTTVLHWYYSDRGNNFLHLALVTLGWLATGGLLLRYRTSFPGVGDGRWLRFSQWLALVGLLVLLSVGHFFGGFD